MRVEVVVSDHAVLRYLERVDGPHPMLENGRIDVEAVRRFILAQGRKEAFAAGVSTVRIGDVTFFSRADNRSETPRRIVTTIMPTQDSGARKSPHPSNSRKPRNGRAKKYVRRKEK